jgi:tetratricopeptide (TPR) repeat protein
MSVLPLTESATLSARDVALGTLRGSLAADAHRAELQRVLASDLFRRSARHQRFLRYVVERTLQGEFDALKEMALGVAVFGRSTSTFDPQLDPIVRVEAARLRAKLTLHYAGEGAHSRLRITIPKGRYRSELVDLGDASEDAPRSDQDESVRGIVASSERSAPRIASRSPDPGGHDEQARDLYQRGRYAAQQRDATAYVKGIDLFRKAIAIDQRFARAHAELAIALLDLAGLAVSPSGPLAAEARVAAECAIALEPDSAGAHVVLAVCAHRVERNWPAAERLFRQAIALAPDSASCHSAFGYALTMRRRFAEAAEHFRLARDLEPLNIGLRAGAGQAASYWRRYAQAERELNSVLEIAPQHAYAEFALGINALYSGNAVLAQEAFRRVTTKFPGHPSPQLFMAAALALDGRPRDARNQLATVLWRYGRQHYCRYHMAMVQAFLADREGLYAALEQAAETCDLLLVGLPVEPAFDAYCGEERFRTFLERNGLALHEEVADRPDEVPDSQCVSAVRP